MVRNGIMSVEQQVRATIGRVPEWRTVTEPIARVRIELRYIQPRIWRCVHVPLSATLVELHEIIQVALGWHNTHLFEFKIGGRSYLVPEETEVDFEWEYADARSVRIESLVGDDPARFTYIYDFGDYWQHTVRIGKRRTGRADVDYPTFVDGARRCPPEDVGGAEGYQEFLEAVLDPGHRRHRERIEWYESLYLDPLDLDDMRAPLIRNGLARIAKKRRERLHRRRKR